MQLGYYLVKELGTTVSILSLDEGADIVAQNVNAEKTFFGFTLNGLNYYQKNY